MKGQEGKERGRCVPLRLVTLSSGPLRKFPSLFDFFTNFTNFNKELQLQFNSKTQKTQRTQTLKSSKSQLFFFFCFASSSLNTTPPIIYIHYPHQTSPSNTTTFVTCFSNLDFFCFFVSGFWINLFNSCVSKK